MNQPQPNHDDLPDYDPEAAVQFRRPPQGLAIGALILGLLSFMAVFKTTLWIFPILTIVLGSVSLFSLARDPEKIGRKAAWLGLALAIFFGSWAASRYFSRQQWLYGHARQKADIWLQLIQENKLYEAHQLHLHQSDRDGYVGIQPSRSEPAESDYDEFYGSSPLRDFVKVAPQATVDLQRVESHTRFDTTDNFVLNYVARYVENEQPQELEMRVVIRRNENPTTGESAWAIYRVIGADDPL